MAVATALVHAVGNGQKHLGFGNAACHGVGKKHIATICNHGVERGHDLCDTVLETLDTYCAAAVHLRPVNLALSPVGQRHAAQQVGGCGFACGGVLVKTSHQRHVDDLAAQVGFGFGQFGVCQGAQGVVFFAAAHRDAHDVHACLSRLLNESGGVATPEQFTKQHKDITFAKEVGSGQFIQRGQSVHGCLQMAGMAGQAARA